MKILFANCYFLCKQSYYNGIWFCCCLLHYCVNFNSFSYILCHISCKHSAQMFILNTCQYRLAGIVVQNICITCISIICLQNKYSSMLYRICLLHTVLIITEKYRNLPKTYRKLNNNWLSLATRRPCGYFIHQPHGGHTLLVN